MTAAGPQPGQPVVFRNATVLTMDDAHTVLTRLRSRCCHGETSTVR